MLEDVLKDDEIKARIERLSPEARALFWEIEWRGEEHGFAIPPEELLVDELARMASLPVEDRAELVGLFRAIARWTYQEGYRLQAEEAKHERFATLIQQAQDLDRGAGRPVKENMTLGEAIPMLEAAGKLDPLERKYLDSVKDEIVWVPVSEEDE